MDSRIVTLLLAALLAGVLLPPAATPAAAQATARIHSTAVRGPSADSRAGLDPAIDAFVLDIGGDDLGEDPHAGVSGYRHVTFDDVPDAEAAPARFPGDYYGTVSPRGLRIEQGDATLTGAEGLMVSGLPPGVDPSEVDFGNLNATYPGAFTSYSTTGAAERMLTSLGTTTIDLTFTVPGSDTPAGVRGLGAVFVDVDSPGSRLELFDRSGVLLASEEVEAAAGDEGLSFLGATFGTPIIARARLTLGSTAPHVQGAPNDLTQGGRDDVVVLDDLVFAEPQPLDLPAVSDPGLNLQEPSGLIETALTGTPEEVRTAMSAHVALFRMEAGHPDLGDSTATTIGGRREVDVDDLASADAHPSTLPPTLYDTAHRRGVAFEPLADGLAAGYRGLTVSAPVDAGGFAALQESYATAFTSLEPRGRLLTPLGDHRVAIRFTVPGTAMPGAVDAIGVVVSDVDLPDTSRIRMLDIDGRLVHEQLIPAAAGEGGLSFVAMHFARPVVHRIELVLGDGVLGPGGPLDVSDGGSADLVAIDRLIIAEPRPSTPDQLLLLEDDGTTMHVVDAQHPEESLEIQLDGLAGERLRGIEVDPGTGTVYGIGSTDTLFCIDGDGIALPVRTLEISVQSGPIAVDMDRAERRLRVMTTGRQHLSINRFEGSTADAGQLAYAADDQRARRSPIVTALALAEDGTGWAIDGADLARWDGSAFRSAGALGIDPPPDTGLDFASDGSLWTIVDTGGPGLARIDTVTGRPAQVGDLPARMIDLARIESYGPCPPSPVVIDGSGSQSGWRVTVGLEVLNDHERLLNGVSVDVTLPEGWEPIRAIPGCTRRIDEPILDCAVGSLAAGDIAHVPVVLGVDRAVLDIADLPETITVRATVAVGGEDADHAAVEVPLPANGFVAPSGEVGGDDVVAVAIELSQLRFDDHDAAAGGRTAPFVVLSRDDDFADSLAGTVLTREAPLLFSGSAATPPATLAEIDRLLGGSGTVFLLGGEAALGPQVAAVLQDAGYTPERLAGASRFETAVQIAAAARFMLGNTDEVLLARAFGPEDNPTAAWADSIAAGGYSADSGSPILLSPSGGLHPAVEEYLLVTGTDSTVLLGGTAALSAEIEPLVRGPRRVAGANRAATAAAIATELWGQDARGARNYVMMNAFDDAGWPFGLAAAGLAADADAPVLMMSSEHVPAESVAHVDGCVDEPVTLTAIGGSLIDDFLFALLDSSDTGLC